MARTGESYQKALARLCADRASRARGDAVDLVSRATSEMPNAVRIELSAGSGCVFHAWTVHRATYRREPVRRTIDAVFVFARPTSV
jgi:hypothetical protein